MSVCTLLSMSTISSEDECRPSSMSLSINQSISSFQSRKSDLGVSVSPDLLLGTVYPATSVTLTFRETSLFAASRVCLLVGGANEN